MLRTRTSIRSRTTRRSRLRHEIGLPLAQESLVRLQTRSRLGAFFFAHDIQTVIQACRFVAVLQSICGFAAATPREANDGLTIAYEFERGVQA
jgi:hypothetical protein